jgi:hypothetical protein
MPPFAVDLYMIMSVSGQPAETPRQPSGNALMAMSGALRRMRWLANGRAWAPLFPTRLGTPAALTGSSVLRIASPTLHRRRFLLGNEEPLDQEKSLHEHVVERSKHGRQSRARSRRGHCEAARFRRSKASGAILDGRVAVRLQTHATPVAGGKAGCGAPERIRQ